ncbi:hypothetical protein C8F04DRAFT_1191496 [Mycena alexandri]|uniref:Uncharacterized protein n=1 Tax=Mycena alexandri TaxID=1745969 RepID=A0AAD6WVY8_9AGAR|nr:hypothetical protein C8F04DRAFT_1191496 [Mycena alexandri]
MSADELQARVNAVSADIDWQKDVLRLGYTIVAATAQAGAITNDFLDTIAETFSDFFPHLQNLQISQNDWDSTQNVHQPAYETLLQALFYRHGTLTRLEPKSLPKPHPPNPHACLMPNEREDTWLWFCIHCWWFSPSPLGFEGDSDQDSILGSYHDGIIIHHKLIFPAEELETLWTNLGLMLNDVQIGYQQVLDASHHGHPTVVERVHTGWPGRPRVVIDPNFLQFAHEHRSTSGIGRFLNVSRGVVRSALLRQGLVEPQAAPFADPPSKNTEVPVISPAAH